MSDLYKRAEDFMQQPLTDLGRRSIDAFLSLSPTVSYNVSTGLELAKLLDHGLPFALLGANDNSAAVRRTFSALIEGRVSLNNPNVQSTVSEVHACALLNALGLPAEFISRSKHKTADLCITADYARVNVEVARGERKPLHDEVKKHLADFSESLRPGDLDHDIVLFFADANDAEHRYQAFESAIKLHQGETAEAIGAWKVSALQYADNYDFHAMVTEMQPLWWPKSSAAYVMSATRVSPIPRHVYMKSLPAKVDYINPLRRKAENFQGEKGHPFIIALDACHLPNIYDQIEDEVTPFWKLWDDVSGIFIFEPRFWTVGAYKTYIWKLLLNPHAVNPMPPLISESSLRHQQLDLYVFEAPDQIRRVYGRV